MKSYIYPAERTPHSFQQHRHLGDHNEQDGVHQQQQLGDKHNQGGCEGREEKNKKKSIQNAGKSYVVRKSLTTCQKAKIWKNASFPGQIGLLPNSWDFLFPFLFVFFYFWISFYFFCLSFYIPLLIST